MPFIWPLAPLFKPPALYVKNRIMRAKKANKTNRPPYTAGPPHTSARRRPCISRKKARTKRPKSRQEKPEKEQGNAEEEKRNTGERQEKGGKKAGKDAETGEGRERERGAPMTVEFGSSK